MDSFPKEIHPDYQLATESYSTTEGKKKVRVRFIPVTRLSERDCETVLQHLCSFQHLYFCTLKKQKEKSSALCNSFVNAIEDGCMLYERYVSKTKLIKTMTFFNQNVKRILNFLYFFQLGQNKSAFRISAS